MIIEEINEGVKIAYTVDELAKSITFGEITVNLEAEQKNIEKVIDISLDSNKKLTRGLSKWYVANIIIPAASYTLTDTGQVDEHGSAILVPTKDLLALVDVKLILWSLP